MTTISLKLPDSVAAQIDAAARAAHKTRNAYLREMLVRGLPPKPAEGQKRPSLYDLSKDLCGSVASKLGDLSTNPKYLQGYGK